MKTRIYIVIALSFSLMGMVLSNTDSNYNQPGVHPAGTHNEYERIWTEDPFMVATSTEPYPYLYSDLMPLTIPMLADRIMIPSFSVYPSQRQSSICIKPKAIDYERAVDSLLDRYKFIILTKNKDGDIIVDLGEEKEEKIDE